MKFIAVMTRMIPTGEAQSAFWMSRYETTMGTALRTARLRCDTTTPCITQERNDETNKYFAKRKHFVISMPRLHSYPRVSGHFFVESLKKRN
jgi:hypothetical protein